MFDLRRAPIVRLLVPFAAGSVMGFQYAHSEQVWMEILFCLLLLIILVVLFTLMKKQPGYFMGSFSAVVFLLFLAAGCGTGMVAKPADPDLPLRKDVMIRGEVLEEPQPGTRSWVFTMRLRMVVSDDSAYAANTILNVYLETPADSILPLPGECWQFYGQLVAIRNSGNPGQHDYEATMHRKNYWYRFFVHDQFALNSARSFNRRLDKRTKQTLSSISMRKVLSQHWEGGAKEISLLKAVCLGDKSGMTDDMRQVYSGAGGMHLLAVSGLHVGLIWWVLHHSLSWMVRITRREIYRAMTIITLLWFYAFITGFSSSVCRSVTMFTLFSVARMLDQRSHPVNGILVSAFLLILLNPGRIMDVGFQLSYAAILGIVTLYPILRSMLKVKNRILKWVWEAAMVSLVAQISTAPLVVYYFHQLPVYSLLTSLVAIPMLSCMLTLFVISIPFMTAGLYTDQFNWLLVKLGGLMNQSMEIVASLPGSVIDHLYLDRTSMYLIVTLIFLGIVLLYDRTTISRHLMLLMAFAVLCWSSWSRYSSFHSSEFVVAHFNGGSLVTFRVGIRVDHYKWCRDPKTAVYMDQYVESVWGKRRYGIHTWDMCDSLQQKGSGSGCQQVDRGIWILGNNRFKGLVVTGSFRPDHLKITTGNPGDFILLLGEPRLAGLLEIPLSSGCSLIVDGSNRRWYSNLLKTFYDRVHITSDHGAYLKRW